MIELRHLSFSFGKKEIIHDLSLTIPKEGITAFSGSSGFGKTTLLRLLAGLEQVTSGEILGISPHEIAFLFQENRLLPWRTVRQHITDVLPKEQHKDADQWLSLVELENESAAYPNSLSGGMARRLALARCAALGGKLLVLDEPFTGVDPERSLRIFTRLKSLPTPILLVTHETELLSHCDRIIYFSETPLHLYK